MIAQLAGELVERNADHVVIDVGGVGYRVFVSTPTLASLPAVGDRVRLKVHTLVREDAFLLYGFAGDAERALFRTLIGLSKIGPKAAMQILSGLPIADLVAAIVSEDVARLTSLPGVGRKTAERLIVELKDSISGFADPATSPAAAGGGLEDAIAALGGLGVPRARAERALAEAARGLGDAASLPDLVKAALRVLKPG